MSYARRLDKLKLRQQITLCGRGGAAGTDARWNVGLAPAIPEDGGRSKLAAQQLKSQRRGEGGQRLWEAPSALAQADAHI